MPSWICVCKKGGYCCVMCDAMKRHRTACNYACAAHALLLQMCDYKLLTAGLSMRLLQ